MAKEVEFGDRLISVKLPSENQCWHVRDGRDLRISVGRLPGPMGWYLTAQITFSDQSPDIVIPLHMAEQFEIQYGD